MPRPARRDRPIPGRCVVWLLAVLAAAPAWADEKVVAIWDRAFEDATRDRNAPLRQLQLEFGHDRPLRGQDGESGWNVSMNPTMPAPRLGLLPRSVFDLSLPVSFAPTGGLGDLETYQTFLLDVPDLGSVGAGPAVIAPTATADALGQGKWQLGGAATVTVTALPHWTIGFTAREYVSVGGDADRPWVSQLLVEPALTRGFPHGWFAGASDFDWQVDWRRDELTLPVGAQLGRVFRIGDYAVSLSVEGAWIAVRPQDTAGWTAALEATLFFYGLIH